MTRFSNVLPYTQKSKTIGQICFWWKEEGYRYYIDIWIWGHIGIYCQPLYFCWSSSAFSSHLLPGRKIRLTCRWSDPDLLHDGGHGGVVGDILNYTSSSNILFICVVPSSTPIFLCWINELFFQNISNCKTSSCRISWYRRAYLPPDLQISTSISTTKSCRRQTQWNLCRDLASWRTNVGSFVTWKSRFSSKTGSLWGRWRQRWW